MTLKIVPEIKKISSSRLPQLIMNQFDATLPYWNPKQKYT